VGELSDETLMAYADNALEAAERRRVEALVSSDPELRVRLAAFTATSDLSPIFDKPMKEPAPQHLVDLVMRSAATPAREAPAAGLWDALARFFSPGLPQWPVAVAYSAGLLIAGGAGWYLALQSVRNASPATFAFENGRTVVGRELARVLETLPSGTKTDVGSTGAPVSAQIRLTFNSKQGFCRQYELSSATVGGAVGIACRDEQGRWLLSIQAQAPDTSSSSGNTRPAAGPAAVRATLEQLIVDDAFGAPEESALIANGWRR
jgi:hypothetical protein